ncbi:hypothetical protein SLS56_009319 [Neofusicoccum ribis]|uniref:HpcH/HpaI aldolase/citrate lyase domain-containing protein n=1 Tax=Neofusicoccum ribis TaxID=45134 RepID=A0ABR3SII2_9PEZI
MTRPSLLWEKMYDQLHMLLHNMLKETQWVLIDCEHGNIDDAEMYHAVGAVATAGASPIVRIAGSEPWQIKRALDSGAHGIMIPMCETKDQAAIIAAATHYPASDFPNGIRGAGGLFAPANFGVDAAEYVRSANRRIVVIVQIETRKAIENVEEIASVPGIDALFVGPNDLAASMGYFPFSHASIPEVQHATAQVLAAAQKHGKYAGHFALGAEAAAVRVKQGWHFVNCGADIVAVTAWMSNEMEQLKKMVSSKDE